MKKLLSKYPGILWCLRNLLPMILFPIANFYLFEWYTHNPWETMKVPIQFLNIYFFELLMALFLFVFGRLKWSLRLQSIFFMIVGLANYYVISFRSAPIMPWDIYSIGTAMSVANNFKYTIEKQTVLVLIGFVLLIIAESAVNLELKGTLKWKKRLWGIRIAGAAVMVTLICSFTHMLHLDSTIIKYGMYDKLFTPTVMSKRDGTAVAFLMELQYISVDKPADYSASKVSEILAPFEEETVAPEMSKTFPNIIVIMNEAFSDPAVLGEFETNEDYMPYVHSILNGKIANTISGYLNVSVLGGNTANTEFEFLTGNTMAFLPQGSVAYQQYLKREMPSLASHLKSLGYETIATHPYNSTGWDRNKVYPLLGFDEMYFIRDYKNPEKIRKYVSDKACYDKIIEMYESKPDGTPFFVFNVTMQNHSSYTDEFDNFSPDIEVAGSNSKALNNYLSLMKISDESIKYLTDYFSTADEDTMIIFFGDHQPTNSVVSNVWKLNGKNGNELSETDEANRYKVPYFIWCNFETDSKTNADTSTNFLATDILETAGIPMTAYEKYLDSLSEKYPVITSIRTETANGSSTDTENVMDELNDYAILQYDCIFGK
ncbi:MAG: LTA synthase family protein [Lachnospiraceae bacterium]|nr:LTA synthase family protein [Lachnospiraceae bacterium]